MASISTMINTDEIKTICALAATPRAVRAALKNSVSARTLGCLLASGKIKIESIREYAQKLTEDFTPGKHFQYEAEFSLLAVVLEADKSFLGYQFLRDLADVQVVEMPMSPKVASLCLLLAWNKM